MSPLLRERHRPSHPVLPDVKDLLTKFCTFRKILHGSGRHLCFQLKVELVEKVRFGLEVGKENRLQRLPFLAMPAVGALNLVYR